MPRTGPRSLSAGLRAHILSTLHAPENVEEEDEDTNESEGSDEETPSANVLQQTAAEQVMPLQQNS